jgi:dolichol-phosphate mannosyltransferase
MPLSLSVVVPMHDEADNVDPLAREIHAALDGTTEYEIVFVDDGSTDGTGGRLAALAATDARVRVVQHPARAGQSAATVSGVLAARAPWVATLDGDGQRRAPPARRAARLGRPAARPARGSPPAAARLLRETGVVPRRERRPRAGARRRHPGHRLRSEALPP